MVKDYSIDFKFATVKYYKDGHTLKETAKVFGCNIASVSRWVKRANSNILERKERKLMSYKIKKKHIAFIKELVKKHKFSSLQELNNIVKKKFDDYDITPQWLGKLLQDNFITRKRTRVKHFPEKRYGKDISFEEEYKKFFQKVKKYSIDDIISIDETSIKPAMVKEYCRELKGKRCYFRTKDSKMFNKYTLVVAICSKGLVGYKIYDKGGMNSDRFIDFLNEICLTKHKNKVLLFDNAKAHTAKVVLNKITDSGNHYILNIPYHPQTNPVESYFNQIKHYMKLTSAIKFEDLKKSAIEAMKKVKKIHYKNYFINSLQKYKYTKKKFKIYKNPHLYKN